MTPSPECCISNSNKYVLHDGAPVWGGGGFAMHCFRTTGTIVPALKYGCSSFGLDQVTMDTSLAELTSILKREAFAIVTFDERRDGK